VSRRNGEHASLVPIQTAQEVRDRYETGLWCKLPPLCCAGMWHGGRREGVDSRCESSCAMRTTGGFVPDLLVCRGSWWLRVDLARCPRQRSA